MGIAGFVISLVGIVTCGLLSPLGLIFSLIGLGRQPKGLAIAGTVISALGTLLLAGTIIVLVMGGGSIQALLTRGVVETAAQVIEEHRAKEGELPAEEEATELIGHLTDAWGNELRYDPAGDTFVIRSAGADGEFDTEDDVTSSGGRR
jgi:hypothetical protein